MFIVFRMVNFAAAVLFGLCFRWFFRHYGRGARLVFPRGIEGISNIAIGDGVYVGPGCLLAAVPLTGAPVCRLEIGDGTSLGSMNHIYATRRISVGRNVLTANNVYIADNSHGYADPEVAIMNQPIQQRSDVEIGEGTWLGQNVCVIGARIGRHCVIGANSVVTIDIPDLCVAVGSPARVVRRFDSERGVWRPVGLDERYSD